MHLLKFASPLALMLVGAGQAQVLIDFETYPDGSTVPSGASITSQYASRGVVFNSVPIPGSTQATTTRINSPATTSGITFLMPNGPVPNSGGTLILTFSPPVYRVGSYFIDDNLPVQVTAFDASSNIVGTATSDGKNTGFDYWQITNSTGIVRVQMSGGSYTPTIYDGWGIDDLSFVPIPPYLNSFCSNDVIQLSWTTNAPEFTLLSASTLSEGDWSPVLPAPVVVDGYFTVPATNFGGTRFYRLNR